MNVNYVNRPNLFWIVDLYNTYDSIKMFENMAKVNMKQGESARSKACTAFKKYVVVAKDKENDIEV